jgi:hypothetical protein
MSEHDEWPSDETITVIVEVEVPTVNFNSEEIVDAIERALGAERAYEDTRLANAASFFISAKNLISGSLLA